MDGFNQSKLWGLIKEENERQLENACKTEDNSSTVNGRVVLNEIEAGENDNIFHLDEIMEWEVYVDFIENKELPNIPLNNVYISMEYEDGSVIVLTTDKNGKSKFKPLKLGKVIYRVPGIINDSHIMSFTVVE